MKSYLIILTCILFISFISLVGADYVAPTYNNVTIVLDGTYASPEYTNVTVVLGESEETNCNPTLDSDWVITDSQVCDGVQVNSGTGNIIINSGNLSLINYANVSADSLNINVSGDRVFISQGCELRI